MVRGLSLIMALFYCFQAGFVFASERGEKNGFAAKKAADTIAPTVNVGSSLNPPDGGLINNAKPLISAEYMDEGIGISPTETKLFIDGQDVSATAQIQANKITYTPAASLTDGVHKITLDVVDKAGNKEPTSWSFTIQTKPPVIKISSHRPNQYVNRSPVAVTGSVSDPLARIVVNGISAAVEKDVFSANVNLIEGSNTVTAVAMDAFGNTGSDTVTLIVDTKPPVVEILSPTVNSMINTKLVTVTGTADKNASTVTVGTGVGEDVAAEVSAGKYSAKDVKLEEGLNTLTVKAVSLAGNVGSASVRVTVDSIPPKVAITAPRDMTVSNKKMIMVAGTVDKPSALVSVNNTPVQVSRGTFSLSSLILSEGTNTINATAVDRAGNKATPAMVTVFLDTTPPAFPTLSPLPPVTKDSSITVSGTTEAGAQVELYVNSTSQAKTRADEKGAFTLTISLNEGNNAVTATATDAPGNISASSPVMNIYLDTKPPKLL